MQAQAISKYIRISPYKLRPYADVIRGGTVGKAYAWLKTCENRRTGPLLKAVMSAAANAKNKGGDDIVIDSLCIQEIRVDQGPIIRYFKPGAMGRGVIQRKRLSHVKVVVGTKK
jgi:large subunit ribosomal protein L22